jgi:hypothetical protein
MNAKVKAVLDSIIEQFKSGDIPASVAFATFPIPNLPSSKWSLLNQLIMVWSKTSDARGYNQWLEAKRFVKKGAKAIYIFVPLIKKEKENGEDKSFLKGFSVAPVFRAEDTEGEPLDYQTLELPAFPLLERAKELGVDVKAIPGNGHHLGYYSASKKIIALASPEECVFFHEMCHRADDIIKGGLKKGQDALQEITAELGALTLCNIVGLDGSKHLGNSYRYIEDHAEKLGISTHTAVIRVLSETEKVLHLILKGDEQCPTVS